MPTICKIKLQDDPALRQNLDSLYEQSSQIQAAQFSLSLAQHILAYFQGEVEEDWRKTIETGFFINEKWQEGRASQHEVRQIGFAIHRIAREHDNTVNQTILRVVGQAIASAHMKEHAMVASDYAIKVFNLLFPKSTEEVQTERQWQIETFSSILNKKI